MHDWPQSIRYIKYLMRLKGWMTKTPLSSCRIHSFSTATSLPYTYRDCLFSCGRSRALHPQLALVHATLGPFNFSMANFSSLWSAECHPPLCYCCFCLFWGWVEPDSTSSDLSYWSQGNILTSLPTSGLIEAARSEASGYPPFCSIPPSLRTLSVCLSLFLPHSPPALLFFFTQLINYSVSVSHPHINQAVSRGQGPAHINTKDNDGCVPVQGTGRDRNYCHVKYTSGSMYRDKFNLGHL